MDPLSLATAVTALLGPMLPFLIKGGEAVAEEVGKDTWNKAKVIWSKLFSSSADKNRIAVLKTAEAVAAVPDNEALQVVWREELKKLLEADLNLANELEELVGRDKLSQEGKDDVTLQVLGNYNKTIGTIRGQNVDVSL